MTSAEGAGQLPVAILGAGLAGLAAASELRRQGVPVVVYEAILARRVACGSAQVRLQLCAARSAAMATAP